MLRARKVRHKKHRRLANGVCALQILGALLCGGKGASEELRYEVVHDFGPPFPEGALPSPVRSSFVQQSDGNLIGLTETGGERGMGTKFELDAAGHLVTLHSFGPEDGPRWASGLIHGTDGNLYGTTGGTTFKVDSTGVAITLNTLDQTPGPLVHLQAGDGSLYGTTFRGGETDSGTIFRIDPAGNLTTLHSFPGPGRNWDPSMVQWRDGRLYGTNKGDGVSSRGSIFRLDPKVEATFATLYSFAGPDGSGPGTLLTGDDGWLYGTTSAGGANNGGTVFKLDPQVEGSFATLYSFSKTDGENQGIGPNTLVQGIDQCLYGTTTNGGNGSLFKLDRLGRLETLHFFYWNEDGEAGAPRALIRGSNGDLYGTTGTRGGLGFPIVYNAGTVFKVDRDGRFTTLHAFSRPVIWPKTFIQGNDGSFYGTTGYPFGSSQVGRTPIPATVFRLDAAGTFSVLGTPGGEGLNTLIQGADGSLYGTSLTGSHRGAIFKLDSAGNLKTLYSFAGLGSGGSDGSGPGTLIQGTDGSLYGTTGSYFNDPQTIFKLDLDGRFATLHTFAEIVYDLVPLDTLAQGNDGNLYGTTFAGGPSGGGIIFKLDLAERKLTTLHSFDAAGPKAIFQGGDGCLYGTTAYGSATIFKLDREGNLTTLHTFTGEADGTRANTLIQGSDGKLYGTSLYGSPFSNESGHSFFKLDREGSLTTLRSFAEIDPSNRTPPTALIQARDGHLYGTIESGGRGNGGVIFRLRLLPSALHRPGDCNQDGSLDLSDAVCLLGFLFLGSPAVLPCDDGTAADTANQDLDWNGDAAVDLSDAVATMIWLFRGGPAHVMGSDCVGIGGCANTCDRG